MGNANRVFLSHTGEFGEFPTGRSYIQAAIEAVNAARCAPTDMKYFGARDDQPAQVCIDEVGQADVYVGILGFRYGSRVKDRPEISYTELEFEEALAGSKPMLLFHLDRNAAVPASFHDQINEAADKARQAAFRKRAQACGKTCDTFTTPDDLRTKLLGALLELFGKGTGAEAEDPIEVYRRHIATVMDQPLPFFGGHALHELHVELAVDRSKRGREPKPEDRKTFDSRSGVPILSLVGSALSSKRGLRWLLVGDAGSGKSTSLRFLARELARDSDNKLAAPGLGLIPIFLSCSHWARKREHPLVAAANSAASAFIAPPLQPLATHLRRAAKTCGRVWFLFDGLDELDQETALEFKGALSSWIAEMPQAGFIVSSRESTTLGEEFQTCQILELDRASQLELVGRWVGSPDQARTILQRIPIGIEVELRRPLFLTLFTKLALRSDSPLPTSRAGLLRDSINHLLDHGYSQPPRQVRNAEDASKILAALAYKFQFQGTEEWEDAKLASAVGDLCKKRPQIYGVALNQWWDNKVSTFLEDLRHTRILAPDGEAGTAWRFLHRSFHEYLAATALAKRKVSAIEALLEKVGDDTPRFGGTLALLAELTTDEKYRQELLDLLQAKNPRLLIQVLRGAGTISIDECLQRLSQLPVEEDQPETWEGNDFRAIVHRRLTAGDRPEDIQAAVIRAAGTQFSHLLAHAYLAYGLEQNGIALDRPQFFTAIGRWPGHEPRKPSLKRIPPDPTQTEFTFIMGSPEPMPGAKDGDPVSGYSDERPRHPVTLTWFELAKTPVTVQEYQLFDRDHGGSDPQHPVTEVSWWEAWLYCRWLGGHLPTEAQWEAACRAGTSTPWWGGASEEEVSGQEWYRRIQKSTIWPVGQCRRDRHPWGLQDMNGLVWQWCHDWLGDYSPDPTHDPAGPQHGSGRVLRGGSFGFVASGARSACRFGSVPRGRFAFIGFRVCFPRALSSTFDP